MSADKAEQTAARMNKLKEIEAAFRTSAEIKQAIVRHIGSFTVAIFAVSISATGDQLELAGTGTLFTTAGVCFLLTAAHVWAEVLARAAKVGITLDQNINHRFLIDVSAIAPYCLREPGGWSEWGPDLALLRIPSEHLGTIRAYKAFYDPAIDAKKIPTFDHVEVSVLMGTPAVHGKFTQRHADVEINGMFLPEPVHQSHEGLDYFDLAVNTSSPGLPKSFGGVSGGGLWTVRLFRSQAAKIEWTQTLEGVAFYESKLQDGHRTIRCHGPESIRAAVAIT